MLSFTDDQLDQVMAACAPLDPERRKAFVEAVAAELAGCPVLGPGAVHRAIAVVQRKFYDPPNVPPAGPRWFLKLARR